MYATGNGPTAEERAAQRTAEEAFLAPLFLALEEWFEPDEERQQLARIWAWRYHREHPDWGKGLILWSAFRRAAALREFPGLRDRKPRSPGGQSVGGSARSVLPNEGRSREPLPPRAAALHEAVAILCQEAGERGAGVVLGMLEERSMVEASLRAGLTEWQGRRIVYRLRKELSGVL